MPFYETPPVAMQSYSNTNADGSVIEEAKKKVGQEIWDVLDEDARRALIEAHGKIAAKSAKGKKRGTASPQLVATDVKLIKALSALITHHNDEGKRLAVLRKEAVGELFASTSDIQVVKDVKTAIAPVSYSTLLDNWLVGVELDPAVSDFLKNEQKLAQEKNKATKAKSAGKDAASDT